MECLAMNDRIPGTTWDNPIWYRGWRIYLNDVVYDGVEFTYQHDDFDGNSENDNRYGFAKTEADCKAEIDQWIEDHE